MAVHPYVLDTGAILTRVHPTDGPLVTTPAVVAEVRPAAARRYLEQLQAAGHLTLAEPEAEALGRVKAAARATGDELGLSATDLGLLALALSHRGHIVTSDYRIQNTARALDIPCTATTEGAIRQEWRWGLRCSGCRRRFEPDSLPQGSDCPVCGSLLKSHRLQVVEGSTPEKT